MLIKSSLEFDQTAFPEVEVVDLAFREFEVLGGYGSWV